MGWGGYIRATTLAASFQRQWAWSKTARFCSYAKESQVIGGRSNGGMLGAHQQSLLSSGVVLVGASANVVNIDNVVVWGFLHKTKVTIWGEFMWELPIGADPEPHTHQQSLFSIGVFFVVSVVGSGILVDGVVSVVDSVVVVRGNTDSVGVDSVVLVVRVLVSVPSSFFVVGSVFVLNVLQTKACKVGWFKMGLECVSKQSDSVMCK